MMGLLKTLGAAMAMLLLGLATSYPASAQVRSEPPLVDDTGGLALDTHGYSLWLPAPDWLDASAQQSGAIRPQINAVFRDADREAVLEIYPGQETEALWNTLYGARLTIGTDLSLKAIRRTVMAGFAGDCRREVTGFFQLGADDGDNLGPLGMVCGAYDPRLSTVAGLGEITVMSFRREGDVVALVFQQWRGKAFVPSDPATWPVPTKTVETRARQLQAEPRLTRDD